MALKECTKKEQANWHEIQYAKYKSEIHDLKDLLMFMLHNMDASENEVAKKVSVDCIKEQLGIQL